MSWFLEAFGDVPDLAPVSVDTHLSEGDHQR
ncbi:hypothetical protein GGD89_002958 [Roseospira visakhapatnamensis]|uniref:Uncharacterized protein n=1 Tax=Roseospira visakhapatnamensis TaxID=390880 RepID=A0A7W6WB99_9PROT|nr:hypothetical protein [Roseospira visakhapatnamensis]